MEVSEMMYKSEHEELEVETDNNASKEAMNLSSSSSSPVELFHFSCADLLKATMDFDVSMNIEEAGYGSIHKGFLRDADVTIKILNRKSLTYNPQQFHREVEVLSKLRRHPNLVSLIGTCPEICALVYDCAPEESLEDRLMCKNNAPPLLWQTRVQIAIDLCSVLIFLHSTQPSCIVHGNLKPSNVLLDANCVSKLLFDFGTPDPNDALVHVDPVVVDTGEVTPESDVYSFGMILLRLLTGKSGLLSDGSVIVGSELDTLLQRAGEWPMEHADQLAQMVQRCCDMDQKKRPDLRSDVLSVLEAMKGSHYDRPQNLPFFDSEAPCLFICPILQEIMEDPQIASDGFTYEAEAIRWWLDSGHDSSPMTNITLPNHNLTPNHALRSEIQEWLLHNPK